MRLIVDDRLLMFELSRMQSVKSSINNDLSSNPAPSDLSWSLQPHAHASRHRPVLGRSLTIRKPHTTRANFAAPELSRQLY